MLRTLEGSMFGFIKEDDHKVRKVRIEVRSSRFGMFRLKPTLVCMECSHVECHKGAWCSTRSYRGQGRALCSKMQSVVWRAMVHGVAVTKRIFWQPILTKIL